MLFDLNAPRAVVIALAEPNVKVPPDKFPPTVMLAVVVYAAIILV